MEGRWEGEKEEGMEGIRAKGAWEEGRIVGGVGRYSVVLFGITVCKVWCGVLYSSLKTIVLLCCYGNSLHFLLSYCYLALLLLRYKFPSLKY